MHRRYRKQRGDTAYYPYFAARTGLRARQRRHGAAAAVLGTAALALAACCWCGSLMFRGGPATAPRADCRRPDHRPRAGPCEPLRRCRDPGRPG